MSSKEDRQYVYDVLIPELLRLQRGWSREYRQPRDLGIKGEFVGLYRKVRKLKTALWDSDEPPTNWREGLRTIMFEVISHTLLMLCDWDEMTGKRAEAAEQATDWRLKFSKCSEDCKASSKHTLQVGCYYEDEEDEP